MTNDKLMISLSKYVLGRLAGEKIPEIALTLLENGYENDEILELIGMHKPTLQDGEKIFLKGLAKLSIQLPDVSGATYCLARQIAQMIIDGEITPYEGARKIWWDLANVENADRRLKSFIGLASEYEDSQNDEDRKVYERQILKESRILLNEKETNA